MLFEPSVIGQGLTERHLIDGCSNGTYGFNLPKARRKNTTGKVKMANTGKDGNGLLLYKLENSPNLGFRVEFKFCCF